jgi:YHS domain-containing protein
MGILRLVLVAGVLVVGYFVIRSAIKEFRALKGSGPPPTNRGDMVQDPVCKLYVPRGSAVSVDIKGHTYLFCSRACAETFKQQVGRS